MAALLKGGSRRGWRLLEGHPFRIRSDAPCSKLCLCDTHEGFRLFGHEKTASSLPHTGFVSLSSEATSNVHAISNGAPVGFFFKPSGYKRPIVGSGVITTLSQDGVSCNGTPPVSSNATKHGCHSKQFYTCEPMSVTSSKLEMRMYGITGRKNLCRTGWRSFSSLQDIRSSPTDLSSVMESIESESNSLPAENEDFDFRNFPALTSSFFENYERPSEMQGRKKRVAWQSKAYVDKQLTVDSIPKPRGRTYDFGLGDVASKPPPLKAGARPQGGFDIDISFNESEVDACESSPSSLLQRQSRLGNLPLKLPERNKGSGTSKDSRINEERDLGMTEGRVFKVAEDRDFQMREDRLLDHEQDFLWDPYNVDEA